MIILREKEQPLEEMAQFKGFGIIIEVRSNDHGKFGNKEMPAHAHILDGSGKEIAQVALTKETPKVPSDINWYRTENPTGRLASAIIKLANSPSKTAQEAGGRLTVWQNVLNLWFIFHGK